MIEISFLADHPETVPILTGWFRAQWPEYYAGRTPDDIAGDFYEEAQRSGGLTVCMLIPPRRSVTLACW